MPTRLPFMANTSTRVTACGRPVSSTRNGPLEGVGDTEIAAVPKRRSESPEKRAVDREVATAVSSAQTETEIARPAALKQEPRFAADAIEKVGRGTRVTVLRTERDWIQVKVTSSGSVGYLRKEYVTAFNTRR